MKYAPHAILAVLVAALLGGQRFGFAWAGGTGYVPERGAAVIEMTGIAAIDRNGTVRDAELWHAVRRGETIRTGPGERARLQLSFAHEIALDENTDLTITSNTTDGIVVRLSRGRIYVNTHMDANTERVWGDHVTVETNFTSSTIRYGALSVVNYDFRETVSVAPVGTAADISVENGDSLSTEKPVDIHETSPVSITEASFDPSSGAAADFYAWAIE